MNGQIDLVALIVGIATIAGLVDLLRQPGWAWKRAEESKIAYLVLVVLVPIVGLSLYVFKGRPKVSARAAAHRDEHWPVGAIGGVARPMGFDAFHAAVDREAGSIGPVEETPQEVSGTFFSSGGTATKAHPVISLARTYRPKQRTTLAPVESATPTVPAGWKADPTGRHQFRYWDGFHWTENVADSGEQSRDAVA
jgi:hypothetical protein